MHRHLVDPSDDVGQPFGSLELLGESEAPAHEASIDVADIVDGGARGSREVDVCRNALDVRLVPTAEMARFIAERAPAGSDRGQE